MRSRAPPIKTSPSFLKRADATPPTCGVGWIKMRICALQTLWRGTRGTGTVSCLRINNEVLVFNCGNSMSYVKIGCTYFVSAKITCIHVYMEFVQSPVYIPNRVLQFTVYHSLISICINSCIHDDFLVSPIALSDKIASISCVSVECTYIHFNNIT
jgi:hypothetical protein